MSRPIVRILAALIIAALLWWLVSAGLWDFALLGLLFAALGGVIVRPKRERRFRPDTWRREVTVPRGE